jgi:hypothetical protein
MAIAVTIRSARRRKTKNAELSHFTLFQIYCTLSITIVGKDMIARTGKVALKKKVGQELGGLSLAARYCRLVGLLCGFIVLLLLFALIN